MFLAETLILDSNDIFGVVPDEVCERHNSGNLAQISTDCKSNELKVKCSCCFNCPNTKESTSYACQTTKIFDVDNFEANNRAQKIRNKCLDISGTVLCQHNSPQNLAMRWLVEDDRLKLDADSPYFAQRYVIAVIYFSLGPDAWVDAFWLAPNQDECQIPGVSCDSERNIISLIFREFFKFFQCS